MGSFVEIEQSGHILHLKLNRPEKRNALNAPLCREIADAVEAADADPAVHAILLTGAGKSFCAGMDLAEATESRDSAEMVQLHERLFTIGARVTTPIVAGVHGAALAGGTGLVANCHVVVASADANFGLTEARIGLWPFLVFRACALAMGERRSMELALTGRIFLAAEAREYSLVHEIAADPVGRAGELAQQIAGFSALAIRKGMEVVHESRGKGWQEAGDLAAKARKAVFETPAFQEGLRKWTKKES